MQRSTSPPGPLSRKERGSGLILEHCPRRIPTVLAPLSPRERGWGEVASRTRPRASCRSIAHPFCASTLTARRRYRYNHSEHLAERDTHREANVAAEAHSSEARTWLYEAHEHTRRASRAQGAPSQGPLASYRRLGGLCAFGHAECVSRCFVAGPSCPRSARGAFCVSSNRSACGLQSDSAE